MASTLAVLAITIITFTHSQIFVDDDSSCSNECGTESTPYQTIQEALSDVTNNQGSITLKAGTYTGSGNVNLTVQSSFSQLHGEGSNVTIIDCENNGYLPGFGLRSGTFTIQGITIRNCQAIDRSILYSDNITYSGKWGGGLWIVSAYTVIRDIIVEGNEADENGGGLAIFSDAVEIYDTIIRNNKAVNGGGIFISKAYIKLVNVTIEDNEASGNGGGMYGHNGGTVELFGTSIVSDNIADEDGDDVACVNMTNFVIQSDDAEIEGEVYCDGSCTIGRSGDDYCTEVSGTINGNITSNNQGCMMMVHIGCIIGWVLMLIRY